MKRDKLLLFNQLVNQAYECFSFTDFLKLSVVKLHELILYDSGMFYCSISKDCSFFKPYTGGTVEGCYEKQNQPDQGDFDMKWASSKNKKSVMVFKADELKLDEALVSQEPRSSFLLSQEDFHIVCMRIVYKDYFMGEIYLHRSKDKPDFDENDMFFLQLLQPHISTIFHIIHRMTTVNYLESDRGNLWSKGLCLMDENLTIVGGNVTALDMLKVSTVFGSSVLYHIKEICEDLQSEQTKGTGIALRQTSIQTQNGTLLVDVVLQWDEKKKARKFFLSMESDSQNQQTTDYKFKFTKREADIIDGIIQGKNNGQLAAALGLSENTIKTHIQSIYRKAGAKNRTELAYLLMRGNT